MKYNFGKEFFGKSAKLKRNEINSTLLHVKIFSAK